MPAECAQAHSLKRIALVILLLGSLGACAAVREPDSRVRPGHNRMVLVLCVLAKCDVRRDEPPATEMTDEYRCER